MPRRDKAAAAGRARDSAPCLREGEEESAAAGARTRAAAGADAAHLLPRRPLPAARALQPTCSRRAGPRPGGGSSVAPGGGGSGLRCGSLPGGDGEEPGRGGSLAGPLGAAFLCPRRCPLRSERAGAGDGVGPGTAGLGASPLGAAPFDRLPPPPPPPQGLRVSALLAWVGWWPQVLARLSSAPSPGMSRPAPLTLRPRLRRSSGSGSAADPTSPAAAAVAAAGGIPG